MTDTTVTPAPASGLTAVANGAKVAAIVTMVPAALSYLPVPVALGLCGVFVIGSAITASVPAPKKNKVLIALYTVARVSGLCVKYAVPYVAAHLVKDANSESDKT